MSRDVKKYDGKTTPKALVRKQLPKMLDALPGNKQANIQRFQQAAIGVAASPKVADCDPGSVVRAIYECARLNLIPDPVLHLASVVPFYNKGRKEATLIIEYRGLIELMKRANPGLTIWTGTVYENDDFELHEGTEQRLDITKRWWAKGEGSSGDPVLHYACARERDAQHTVMVCIPTQEARAVGEASKAGMKPGTPWHDHFERMAEKTCIRRLERFVRMSPDEAGTVQRALEVDERTDEISSGLGDDVDGANMDDFIDDLPEGGSEPEEDEPKPKKKKVKSKAKDKPKPEPEPEEEPDEEPEEDEEEGATMKQGVVDVSDITNSGQLVDLWCKQSGHGWDDGKAAVKEYLLTQYGLEDLGELDPDTAADAAEKIASEQTAYDLFLKASKSE